MKKNTLPFLLCLSLFSLAANATPVGPMNYQGRLLDDSGVPVTNNYDFVVKIYNDPVAGTLKYQENKSSIPVDDGVYSFKIGDGPKTGGDSSWDVDLWQGNMNDLYLEVEVNGETLLPRHELTSAPHAFTSTLALSAQSLGTITVTDFDNILQNICASSNGKWLELANGGTGTCLGAGTSFPGPTQVSINSLTASTDFTHLDLSRADISGIHFGNVDLSYAIFKGTRYQVSGIAMANLSYSRWDGAIDESFNESTVTGLITGASFKNMPMSRWRLDYNNPSAMSGVSAAYLDSCPTFGSSMYGYVCPSMQGTGAPYFVAGAQMDFSPTSAAATSRFGGVVIDVAPAAFDNANLAQTSFQGVTLTQNFTNSALHGANMSYAHLKNIVFTNTMFSETNFKGSRWDNVMVTGGIQPMNGVNFEGAELNQVRFDNVIKTPNFTGASLKQVDFVGNLGSPNFTNATLENVRISYLHKAVAGICPPDCSGGGGNITFSNTRVYGSITVTDLASDAVGWQDPNWDISFLGARVTGDFGGVTFASSAIFGDAIFSHLDLCGTMIMGLAETNAPHAKLASVLWDGPVECPNGDDVIGGANGSADTCNYSTRMVTPSGGNCTPGVP